MKKDKKINLWYYLNKNKLLLSIYLTTMIIATVCGIFITILSAETITNITLSVELNDKIYLEKGLKFLIGVGILIFSRRILWYLSDIVYQNLAAKIMANLNLDLAKQAFKLNSKTYSDFDTGTFVQRIVTDPERLVYSMANIVDRLLWIISCLFVVVYITTLNLYIGIAIASTIIISLFIEVFRAKIRRKNRKLVRKSGDKINSLTTEIIRSEKDIKCLGLEEKLSEVSKKSYQEYKKNSLKTECIDSAFYTLRSLIIEVCTVLIFILGIIFIDKGLLTLAVFMVIYSNSSNILNLVWGISQLITLIIDMKVSTERMFELFNEKIFVTEKFGNKKVDNVNGKIEFKNVSYSYIEYSKEDGKKSKNKNSENESRKIESVNTIFKDLSFEIQPNTTVAFVGKSGSGKSTILNLMSKMFEAESGEVLIDNTNINDFDKPSLRKTISLVNQFPYIFDMTIRENLLLTKKDATEEELFSAIEQSSLKEFVDSLPKGIDTKVGESGIKLSGGQKQRLAIARALLRNSPIIIFDESTSSLDNFAQEEVKQSIDNLKGKSTIVIVAHRLSTIKNVDKIFFLDEGRIEDSGTFEELFNNNAKFKAMFLVENI